MTDLCALSITGRLGRDPELRDVSGNAVLSASIAVGGRAKVSGEWKDTTTWVRVELWGKRASSLHRMLRRGSLVAASGSCSLREYTDKSGQARISLDLRADQLEPIGPKPSDGGSPDGDIPF